MTKSEIKILRSLVRGLPHWCSYSMTHGQRERIAAESIRDARLGKIVPIMSLNPTSNRYVVIPPHREWDAAKDCLRPVCKSP